MSETISVAWTAVRLALRGIRATPLRSLLTALGILVGVAAVTVVVALSEGASAVVTKSVSTLGATTVLVQAKPVPKSGFRDDLRPSALDDGDLEAVVSESPSIERGAPLVGTPVQVVVADHNVPTSVAGTTRDFFAVREDRFVSGGPWSATAEASHDRVCVLGETVRSRLFGPEDPVGRSVRIGRFPFRVVGLLEKKGQSPWGGDQDDTVLIPLGTLRSNVQRGRPFQLHRLLLAARSAERVADAQAEVTAVLRQRHHLGDGAPDDFEVHTQEEVRKTQAEITGVLEMLLLGIAAVSLVVGGISVMNIMLVSVAERTREIGIRLAIGARAGDIRAQFLVEAVVLSILGGVGGAAFAVVSVRLLSDALELPMTVSPAALAAGLVTSTGIGLVFGFFPARRAARMDPVQALVAD